MLAESLPGLTVQRLRLQVEAKELQQVQQDLVGAQVMLTPDCYAKTHVFVIVCATVKNRSPLSWSSRITSRGLSSRHPNGWHT